MSLTYDFWINNLGFNKRITVDDPEERATAQFKKDQLDSATRVGDQSLTGWWTRGQFSFHKGAGLNYYEVLESETVYDRYKDSDSVAVFKPGELDLSPAMSSLALNTTDAIPAPLSSGGGLYALTNTGVYYTAGFGSTFVDTSDSNVPTDITSSGSRYYLANGSIIERQYSASDVVRVNHVTNPSFETNTTGWTTSTGASLVSSPTKNGSQALKVPGGTSANSADYTVTGLTIGVTYVISAWVYVSTTSPTADGHIVFRFGGILRNVTSTHNTYERVSNTFTATATSHVFDLTTLIDSGTNYPTFYVDSVMVTESPFTSDYFDGSQPGCSWQGTANASKSNYATTGSGASTALITLTGGTWKGVWWAKGRLFAVDAVGNFYALAPTTATVSTSDAFWSTGRTDVSWSVTDSPAAVYISDGSNVYAVSIDTDGLLPTLDAPTTVAQVPLGETISSIGYYLGNLVVATSAGVRVATIQSGVVYLGPLSIVGDFSSSSRIGVWNTLAYVVGRPDGRGGEYVLCAIDLSQTVTDQTYAWSPIATVSTLASTANGAAVDSTGILYSWSGGDTFVASRDELTASGYLTTAYVRFGTLEAKHFSSVLVRVGGAGGTVETFRVDADGTETSLGVVAYNAASTELDLALAAPAERVALKFVLTRDPSDATRGPTLLGYQLKALPLPKRQRMIRVPLMLFDQETDAAGQRRGRPGDAWSRLSAMEALEQANALVTFEDKETGETGSAYIESLEVRRTAPTSLHKNGFGGLLYVTLRKL